VHDPTLFKELGATHKFPSKNSAKQGAAIHSIELALFFPNTPTLPALYFVK
jgi:hypothetical protein